MTSLSLGSFREVRERRHGHFFSISLYRSFNLHIESPWLFDVDRWFHFALPASVPREARDDIVQGMEEARAAWLRYSPSMLLSLQSYELRDMLGRSGNRFHMYRMRDHEVAKALYNEVKDGSLIFVPERDEMRKCVQAIREQREKASQSDPARAQQPDRADMPRSLYGNGPRLPQNLGNAQPLDYQPNMPDGDGVQVAGSEGAPRNDQAQNGQFKAVVRALGLNKDQAQRLHRETSRQGFGYHEMLERGREMFGDGDD
ncbi:hypothetical protein AB3X96_21860 [Paraburkholderia sp. BR13439]|uniref:hypothetical protein n=1 Tax=Paraburkholderia sp. BR13439 TaxID=3236996 RepID=UPI0034CF1398